MFSFPGLPAEINQMIDEYARGQELIDRKNATRPLFEELLSKTKFIAEILDMLDRAGIMHYFASCHLYYIHAKYQDKWLLEYDRSSKSIYTRNGFTSRFRHSVIRQMHHHQLFMTNLHIEDDDIVPRVVDLLNTGFVIYYNKQWSRVANKQSKMSLGGPKMQYLRENVHRELLAMHTNNSP